MMPLGGCPDGSVRALPQHRHHHRLFLRSLCQGHGTGISCRPRQDFARIHDSQPDGGVGYPACRRLVDRYGPRRVLLPFTALRPGATGDDTQGTVAAFLKERPENMGLLPDGAEESHVSAPVAANDIGLTLHDAVRTSEFWTMVCILFLVTASVHACFIHLPAILTDRGSSAQLAAFASSLFDVGLFIGRVGCGYLLDQFFAPCVAALLFAAVAIGIAFLGLGHAIWSAGIAAVLIGLGIGQRLTLFI
jgi:hypothetical protein